MKEFWNVIQAIFAAVGGWLGYFLVANKSCPGNWMYARMGDLAEKVTKALQGSSDSGGGSTAKGTQAFFDEKNFLKKI